MFLLTHQRVVRREVKLTVSVALAMYPAGIVSNPIEFSMIDCGEYKFSNFELHPNLRVRRVRPKTKPCKCLDCN